MIQNIFISCNIFQSLLMFFHQRFNFQTNEFVETHFQDCICLALSKTEHRSHFPGNPGFEFDIFGHAWIFTVFMYMFAALLTAVAHYIYFRFIDHGFVINAYESQIDILNKSGVPDIEAYTNMFQETLETVKSLTPIDITMQLVSWNVFCGSLLALPTALFVMRRKKE